MSENKQEVQQTETVEKDVDTADKPAEDVTVDAVAEQRPVGKKAGGGVIGLVVIVMLLGIAGGAAWYYQPIWPAPMKDWMASVFPDKEPVDLMAAPQAKGEQSDIAENQATDTYVLPAISNEKPAEPEQSAVEAEAEAVTEQSVSEQVTAVTSEPASETEVVSEQPGSKQVATDTTEPVTEVEEVTEQSVPELVATSASDSVAETNAVEDEPVAEQVVLAESVQAPEVASQPEADGSPETAGTDSSAVATAAASHAEKNAEVISVDAVADSTAAVVEDVVMEPASEVATATETTVVAPAAMPEMLKDEQVATEAPAKAAVTLQDARAAFWSRDLVRAEGLYLQLTIADAQNPDAWGELGNLYYLQAKWQQAAQAYTQAALQLIDKGDFRQAMFLQFIVRGLDHASAIRIHERFLALQAPVR